MPSPPILEVKALHRSFGGVKALDGATLAVDRGTITGLIGPNGAGKTTLFNLIAGTLKPERGEILFDGENVTGWRPDQLAQRGLTRTFQLARGLPELTVLENFALYGKEQPGEGLWRALLRPAAVASRERGIIAQAWDLAEQLNLRAVANHPTADLSGGQKKLVELGRALLGQPKLLLLDEPMAGVNPALGRQLIEHVLRLRTEAGMTFLFVEHDLDIVMEASDQVIVMNEGRVIASGDPDEVRGDQRVVDAYLGTAGAS